MNQVIVPKGKTNQITIIYWSLYMKLTGKNLNNMIKTEGNLLPMPKLSLRDIDQNGRE